MRKLLGEKIPWYEWIKSLPFVIPLTIIYFFQVKNVKLAFGTALLSYAYYPIIKEIIDNFIKSKLEN